MARMRFVLTAFCLGVLLVAALPGSAAASRSAEQFSASVAAETTGGGLFGEILAWGQEAAIWLQALIAPEHGAITPIVETPPPPAISPAP